MTSSTKRFRSRLFLSSLFFLISGFLFADPVTIKVLNSDGAPLPGVSATWYISSFNNIGVTDANGEATVDLSPGTYNFRVTYQGTVSNALGVTVSGATTVNFQTSKVTINVRQSDGSTPIEGVPVNFVASGAFRSAGSTNSSGVTTTEVFDGAYDFRASYKGTVQVLPAAAISGNTTIDFQTAAVTVNVRRSDGTTAISGVPVTYIASGAFQTVGTTNGSGATGTELFPGTYPFRASYQGTVALTDLVVPASGANLDLYTTQVNVSVETCSGTPVEGAGTSFIASGAFQNFGPTDAGGSSTTELFPGTYPFRASINGTVAQRDETIPGSVLSTGNEQDIEFNPTVVSFSQAGTKVFVASGAFRSANSPVFVFPGTYNFTFNGQYTIPLEISGCEYDKSVAVLLLRSSTNTPLEGGAGRGGYGSNFGTFFISNGPTNASGVAFDIRNTNATKTMSYEMRYNNTTAVLTQDITVNNVYNFQTNRLTLRLARCNNAGLAGGSVRYGAGANFGTWFWPGGNTDANGATSAELFPGTYSFEMGYQSTAEVKSSVVIPAANTTLTWNTTNVSLKWPFDISYGGNGDSRFFNKPSMELLPGTYKFNFRSPGGSNYADLAVSGCTINKTAAVVRLTSSTSQPIAGGQVRFVNTTWVNAGNTGSNGGLVVFIDGTPATRSFGMTYLGAYQQINNHPVGTNPIVNFQTRLVTMQFKDEANNFIESNQVQFAPVGSTSWMMFGAGQTSGGAATMELLPASYSFRLSYDNTIGQITGQNITTNPLVLFQLALVTVTLKDGLGNPIANGVADYFNGSWRSLGVTDANGVASKALLPGYNYFVRMVYLGARNQRNSVVAPSTVNFTYANGVVSNSIETLPTDLLTRAGQPTGRANGSSIIYPNPVINQLQVNIARKHDSNAILVITSLDGKRLISQQAGLNKQPMMDVSSLKPGMYYLTIIHGPGTIETLRFIKGK